MAKAQHVPQYQQIQGLLRQLREEAGLTQRDLGERLGRPQSWIYNCESANRRVDITEFVAWCSGCSAEPLKVFKQVLKMSR
jgi:transcriptional regulator with XRE-family HTH domain